MKNIFLFLLVFSSISSYCNAQIITTYAGSGVAGYAGDGGAATSANLAVPIGLNLDHSGNLLLCQTNLVRKINALTGIITTIAGDTSALTIGDGGPATNALVLNPYSACLDARGNIYIGDYHSITIRKVDITTGIINVYAGTTLTGGATGDGGPATAAKLGAAVSVCIDTVRKILYFADEWNYKVRKVNMITDTITTFAGSGVNGYSGDGGNANTAKLSRTYGLSIDRMGNVYIGDWDNGRIRKVDIATGIITTIAGNGIVGYSGDNGPATNARINKTTGMCFDTCGNLYLTDENNNCVRKIDITTHIITTIAGKDSAGFYGDGGAATAALFNHPTGLCIDKYGNLFVGDYFNNRVRKFTLDSSSCYSISTLFTKNENEADFSCYPNPAFDVLHIYNVITLTEYRITNLLGQIVQQGVLNKYNNDIYIRSLSSGMYILGLVNNEGTKKITRFIKQ